VEGVDEAVKKASAELAERRALNPTGSAAAHPFRLLLNPNMLPARGHLTMDGRFVM
jgi:hypothetical protein